MIFFENKKDCCGCEACQSVCPTNAISMKEDDNGFLYPAVDKQKCVECNACSKVCPIKNADNNLSPIAVYAAVNKNREQLMKSSSGGVFSSIASETLNKNWFVCGAAYNWGENGNIGVKHKIINKTDDLIDLQGSKYVQSSMTGIYKQIRQRLKENQMVLFSGTPCQVAAVKKYVGKYDKNLFTIDIICHGVPSQKMLNEYLETAFGKRKHDLCSFTFRDKYSGWGMVALAKFKTKQGKLSKKRIAGDNSSYYSMFLKSKIYRESCYDCPFANEHRAGDLTIGDYWGIKLFHPDLLKTEDFNESNGISCVLVNTAKGEELLEKFGGGLKIVPSEFEYVKQENHQLKHPSEKPDEYNELMQEINQNGFRNLEKNKRKSLGLKYWVNNLKAVIPAPLKNKIKKILKRT